jgi:choline dehydrogenase-like flavoprotein
VGTIDTDVVIVGAGLAGCAVVNRLCRASAQRIVLLEAGPGLRPGTQRAVARRAPRRSLRTHDAPMGLLRGLGRRTASAKSSCARRWRLLYPQ